MTISHLLETFEDFGSVTSTSQSSDDKRTDHELAVYERGYKAGWDDATTAAEKSSAALSEHFAQNVSDLSFTYHEAYTAVLRSLEPLVRQLIETTLPDLAIEGLGQTLAAEVAKIARSHAGSQVTINCHSSKRAMLQAALPTDLSLDLSLLADASLSPDQVFMKFDGVEREIDITRFATQSKNLIHNFFEDIKREPNNG